MSEKPEFRPGDVVMWKPRLAPMGMTPNPECLLVLQEKQAGGQWVATVYGSSSLVCIYPNEKDLRHER